MGLSDDDATSVSAPVDDLASCSDNSNTITLTAAQLKDIIGDSVAAALRSADNSGTGSSTSSTENIQLPSGSSLNSRLLAPIAFKAPQPLFSQNPLVWFEILEQQFNISRITSEQTRYSHALGALDSRLHDQFGDLIIRDKGTTPYTTFKNEIIKGLGESVKTKLNNVLHGLTLGELKPSQLLSKIRFNAGNYFNDESIKELWLKRLPQQAQMVLTAFENDFPLNVLAERADNLMETMCNLHINAVEKPNSSKIVPSACSISDLLDFKKEMLTEMNKMINSINNRSRSPNRSHSRSRRYRSNSIKNETCYYHYRFGDKAKKCLPGCKHYQSTSQSSQPLNSKNR
jgi:hypothetical protein